MNVLLIGDSIRGFYQDEVKTLLGDDYNVYTPGENCKFSAYILNSLRFWLEKLPVPDIIHFNAGLWDTAILYREDGCFIGVDEYVGYMKKVVRILKNTGATVIFATTTPVSDDKCDFPGPMPPAHRNSDIMQYNSAILKAFEDENIIINDLFSLMYKDKENYLRDDKIHPNDDGVKLLAAKVAKTIKECGNVKNNNTFAKCKSCDLDDTTKH